MNAGTSIVAGARPYFRPRRLGHVNLWVDDIRSAEKFYNDVCGLNVAFTEPGLIASFLGTGHTPHDLGLVQVTRGIDRYGKDGSLLIPGHAGTRAGLFHIAWELENEKVLIDGFRRLRADNLSTLMIADHQVAHSIYIADPDGNANEYYCDTIKDWRSKMHGAMDLITSAWDPDSAEGFTEPRYDENPIIDRIERAAIHPYRLTHVVLCTGQLPALERFYTTVGGLRVVERMSQGSQQVVYLAPALTQYLYSLVLISGDESGFRGFSFELSQENELETAVTELKRQNVHIECDVHLPWKRSLFLRDADGVLSEYYVQRTGKRALGERGDLPLEFVV